MSSTNSSAIGAFSEFALGLRYEALPRAVQELMPVLLIDYFRAGAVGRRMDWTARAQRVLLDRLSADQTCSVLFSQRRSDVARAAYLNGVVAGSLDWDDSHVGAIIHPGVVIWPAAIAAAEQVGADGRRLVEAVVSGYETAIRIGMSIQPDHAIRGFQGTPTCGIFGAAIAAGRLFGLAAPELENALGIAAHYASGLAQFFISGSDVKRLHAGKAAAQGVEAAMLARAGITAPEDAIDGVRGFCHAFSDSFSPDVLTTDLGSHFWLTGISLKVHATTVRVQTSIEAAEALARSGVTPELIDRVEIGVARAAMGKLTGNAPGDQQAAQLSAPFAVAATFCLLAGGGPEILVIGTEDFGRLIKNPEVMALTSRTTCVVDEEMDRAVTKETVPARVTVFLKDGRRLESVSMQPKGSPANPLTADEVGERFALAASAHFAEPRALNLWLDRAKAVHALESAADLMKLPGTS